MTDRSVLDVDAALDALAADVAAATPRPGADLVARVLADAANLSAAAAVPDRAPARRTGRESSLADLLFGWGAGVTAAAALALMVGIGVGMEIDADLPMVAMVDEPVVEFFSADSGLLPDDFL